MTNHERLAYLLNRLMAEEASEAEHEEMLQLIGDPAHEQHAKNKLFTAYQTAGNLQDLPSEKSQQILEAILQSGPIVARPATKHRILPFRRWAAAAAVLIICASAGFYFLKSSQTEPPKQAAVQHDAPPGGNKATLTLANGKVISLTDAGNGKIATDAGLVITKQADGQLLYEVAGTEEATDGYNTITTPYGGKYEIVLQDGTRVILNSGSKITYPLSFGKTQRKVTLTGEAYFEVAKDESRSFIVATPGTNGVLGQEISVLGTHFNVNAYEDEQAFVTTLLEGSIKIAAENNLGDKLLKPGQQAVIRQSITVSNANVDAAVAWTNDLFYFTDLPLKDMMRKLARWYDVEVVYQGEVPSIGFWAQISKNKNLSEVLATIETTNSIHFKIEGRKLIVSQ